MIVCFSRCYECGVRTPHEICHRHSKPNRLGHIDEAAVAASADPEFERYARLERSRDRAWRRWSGRTEVCPPTCQGDFG